MGKEDKQIMNSANTSGPKKPSRPNRGAKVVSDKEKAQAIEKEKLIKKGKELDSKVEENAKMLDEKASNNMTIKSAEQVRIEERRKEAEKVALERAEKAKKKLEQRKKIKKASIIAVGVVALAVVVKVVLTLNAPKYTDLHVEVATELKDVADKDNSSAVSDSSETTSDSEEQLEVAKKQHLELNYQNSNNLMFSVNTKLADETEYTEHIGKVNVMFSNFITGYKEIYPLIKKYNDSINTLDENDKRTAVDISSSEEEFYKGLDSNDELAYFEVKVSIPNDFPTDDLEKGYTGLKLGFNAKVVGTEKKDKIITENYEYDIPKLTSISELTNNICVGQTYKLKYIVILPKDVKQDNYKIQIQCKEKDKDSDLQITLNGVDISKL